MRTKAPLHAHLLFHPSSKEARSLATTLLTDWMGHSGLQGLRVPVYLGREDGTGRPGPVDVDRTDHTLVVLLVDSWMTDRISGQGDLWAGFARDLAAAHPPGGPHHVLPVALDDAAFDLDPDFAERHFLTLTRLPDPEQRQARLSFTMAVRALHLLAGAPQGEPDSSKAPITLFVSHAKKDLDTDRQDPVRWTQDALAELPVREWFDAREIREGAEFESEIRSGVERANAMLVFLTDAWASRPWCRTEALIAKELGTPIVVVDALTEGEPRSFPYGGNTRLLRWRPAPRPPEDPAKLRDWQRLSRTEGERMIAAAVREALRRVHARRRLEHLALAGDVVLDIAPEAARMGWEPPGASFLYPDPPLGREEQKLLARIWPTARFETPMMRIARRRKGDPASPLGLAVSVSESPDLAKHGLTPVHQRLLTDEIHLYLMVAGLQIIYGGKLDPESLDDPDNFTLRLLQLVRGYSGLAADVGASLAPLRNVVPWPLWTRYNHDVSKVFGRLAKLEKVPLPDFGVREAELGAQPDGFVPPVTPLQAYAWARALTEMRQQVTASSAARLSIGGRIEGYKGRLPGLVEEPLLSLRAGKPLFLVGALGGCTELVIDLLEQRERGEMTEAVAAAKVPGHAEIRQLYERYGGEPASRDEVAAELRERGKGGPAAALGNGLDDEENRELFATPDPHRIATLVLTGLERLEAAER